VVDDFFASNIAVEQENFPKNKSLNFDDIKRYQISLSEAAQNGAETPTDRTTKRAFFGG
jgi:hypothetical protein